MSVRETLTTTSNVGSSMKSENYTFPESSIMQTFFNKLSTTDSNVAYDVDGGKNSTNDNIGFIG